MRPGVINSKSLWTDALGVLSGTWDEYDRAGWHVVVTPFLTAISGTFAAGKHALPFAFSGNVQMSLSHADGDGSFVTVKAGQKAVEFDRPCVALAFAFGAAAKAVSV